MMLGQTLLSCAPKMNSGEHTELAINHVELKQQIRTPPLCAAHSHTRFSK